MDAAVASWTIAGGKTASLSFGGVLLTGIDLRELFGRGGGCWALGCCICPGR